MSEEKKKLLRRLIFPIILCAFLLFGISYAWLTLTLNGTKENVLKVGNLSLQLIDTTSNGINMDKVVPVLDEVGLKGVPYNFTLTNNGTVESFYTIYLDDVVLSAGETKLPDNVIKYNLVKDNTSMATKLLNTTGSNPNRVLDSGVISPNTTYTYDLRLWLDENATIEQAAGKVFRGKIRVEAEQAAGKPTPEFCFDFDNSTGTITEYKCQSTVSGYPDIRDVIIPSTINGVAVTKIGDRSFYRYSGGTEDLNSVVIPNSVKEIGDSAFYECYLEIVTFQEGLEVIGLEAFMFNNLTTLTFPSTIQDINSTSFSHNQLTKVIFKRSILPCYEAGACSLFDNAWAPGYNDTNIIWNG